MSNIFDIDHISILYVDNNTSIKKRIHKELINKKINVTVASSSRTALKKFKKKQYDLIITALDLEGINAFRLLKKIRKIEPDIHAIILLEDGSKKFSKGLSNTNILNDFISKKETFHNLYKFIKKNIKKTCKRRSYKETYSLLGHYKEALDESWVVIKTNFNGIITYANDNFYKISGYSKGYILGKNITTIRSQAVNERLDNKSRQTTDTTNIIKDEIEYVKKDGDSFFMESTIIPVIDNFNDILEYISVSFDITHLKKTLKKAEEAKEAKSVFLANMSHEVRTPLNGILGFCKLLKEENLNKNEEKEYINVINRSASTLLGTINEILDISKIESGKFELELDYFNPSVQFEIVVELFSSLAAEKNINYLFYLDPKLPKKILGDSLRIKQILTNLISNAIKFTPQNGEIYIEVIVLELGQKCKFKVSVTDNGIGISKENQEIIFNPFEQVGNFITKKYGGTGLGLSISFNILSLMNSEITLNSKPGKGSAFSFMLETPYQSNQTSYDNIKSLRILIFSNSDLESNKQMLIIQKYLQNLAQTKVKNNIDDILKFDILIIEYHEFIKLDLKQCSKPIIVLHSNSISLNNFDISYVILKTPVNLDKLYSTILNILGLENTNTSLIQHSIRKNNIKFKGNVLIAEDDEINQQLIQIILENRGVNVNTVNNGEEAIEYVTKLHQDTSLNFILMDINMPIVDGILATQKIKQFEDQYKVKHIPIIALTANAISGDKEKYLRFGMDNYLTKPIKYPDLYEILERYLEKDSNINTCNSNSDGDIIDDYSKTNTLNYSIKDSAALVGVKEDVFKRILVKYVNSFEENFDALKNHIHNNNFEETSILAHKLKGSSGNMNILKLFELFKTIELSAKDKKSNTYTKELEDIQKTYKIIKNLV